ncbi:hypothetical protein [Sulfuricurvum sp.]|uniref:hypothetical protein n=1 Tax=Sulfuricurvum sp. TaxID=2025608 RepID=UPI0035633F2C
MGSVVTLAFAGNEYQVSAPEYGYTTKIVMPFHWQRKLPLGYSGFDDGTQRDIRIWSGSFILTAAQATTFLNFYADADKGRGVNVGIRLPKNSGFTPFGPDKGDYGNYSVTVHDVVDSGMLLTPYKHFSIKCNMTAHTYPSVSVPRVKTDGSFQIGTVTGLRFPEPWPQPAVDYAMDIQFTRNGTAKTIDRLAGSDHCETTLKMVCNRSRAYSLLYFLTNTARTNDLTITTASGTYLFGLEKGTSGVYTCQWIDTELEVTHVNFDRYEFSPTFSLVSVA